MDSLSAFTDQDVIPYRGVPRLRRAIQASATVTERTSPSLDVHHASPLAPLRDRDAKALEEFFNYDRVHDIALDIHRYLARIYPEPCWEDEPYDFLRGFV